MVSTDLFASLGEGVPLFVIMTCGPRPITRNDVRETNKKGGEDERTKSSWLLSGQPWSSTGRRRKEDGPKDVSHFKSLLVCN